MTDEDYLHPDADPTMRIEIDHDAYYVWEPVSADEADADTIESSYAGISLRRAVVHTPTTSTTDVHLPGVAQWKDDRVAAGKSGRSNRINLFEHLIDGPWDRHFPIDSITAIRCTDPQWEQWLNEHFVNGGDDYLHGSQA